MKYILLETGVVMDTQRVKPQLNEELGLFYNDKNEIAKIIAYSDSVGKLRKVWKSYNAK